MNNNTTQHHLNDVADISLDVKTDLFPLWTGRRKNWFPAFRFRQIQVSQYCWHKVLNARLC